MQRIFNQAKNRFPWITTLLIMSCLLTTLPQIFLPELYSKISGQIPTLKTFDFITLHAFSHSPGFLPVHLMGNILVFLIFGGITELVIGSPRFAFISLVTFFTTTTVNFLHAAGTFYVGHGVSGVCWGYHVFYIFILIVIYENQKKAVFKNGFILFSLLLIIFDFIGIPAIEVLVMKRRFFENFGQTIHLLSNVIVVPFALLWRGSIEENTLKILSDQDIHPKNCLKGVPVILLMIVLLLNAFGTIKLINLTGKYGHGKMYSVIPPTGTDIRSIDKHIKVKLKYPSKINSEKLIKTSINYESEKPPEFKVKWIDAKTLEVVFARNFTAKETVELEYLVQIILEGNISTEVPLNLKYK